MDTWNKLQWLFWVFVIVVGGIWFFFISSVGSSSGYHTGIVTAIEHNSNIIYPANVVYFKTNTMSSQEDKYCVNDNQLIQKLVAFQQNRTEITILYDNDFIMWKWQCNGGESIIIDVSEG